MPDISLITAVRNRAATIGRAMDSVTDQKTPPAEHLVVDGASDDGTLAIVRDRAGPTTRVTSEPDKGIYDALNKGIGAARGRVIGLLHSDDVFADETVLTQVEEAFGDPDLDAVYADATFFRPGAEDRVVRRYSSARFSPEQIAKGIMPAHPTLYLHRRVFERFGLYRTDYRIAADYEFIARIFAGGTLRTRYVPSVWVRMQTGGASTAGLRSKITLNNEVIRACRENGIETGWLKLMSKYPAKLAEMIRPGQHLPAPRTRP